MSTGLFDSEACKLPLAASKLKLYVKYEIIGPLVSHQEHYSTDK